MSPRRTRVTSGLHVSFFFSLSRYAFILLYEVMMQVSRYIIGTVIDHPSFFPLERDQLFVMSFRDADLDLKATFTINNKNWRFVDPRVSARFSPFLTEIVTRGAFS